VAGIDELRSASIQWDPQKLARGQDPGPLLEKGVVGAAGLLDQGGCNAAGASGGVDENGGDERGVEVMTHGVGQGQVQGLAVQGVVVGVSGDALGGHQGAGQGELGGASQEGAVGRSCRWISAGRLTGAVRWAQW
jgi:hypothetical protein